MIRGYPVPSSVLPGETVVLHVSTDQSQFRVEIYRQGVSLVRMEEGLVWQRGYPAPPAPMGEDWGWFCYGFPVPDHWQSGVYIARLIEGDERGNPIGDPSPGIDTTNGFDKALFVVKSASPGESASILYKLTLFTYHAYAGAIDYTNDAEQQSLYANDYNGANNPRVVKPVTLHRPGGGTGEGHKIGEDKHDWYDREANVTSFEHFDAKFIRWLETNGYKVDYCTDLDVHEDPNLLTPYRLLVIGGHDEYWSEDERQHVEAFVHSGGNLAIFSGNTCWRIVHLENGNTTMGCNKAELDADRRPVTDYLDKIEVDLWFPTRPENSLTGVSFRHADQIMTLVTSAIPFSMRTTIGYSPALT
jgi:hypothetical protein